MTITASCAAAAEPDRIQSDRPNVAVGAGTVPFGDVQFEGGAQYQRTSIGGSPAERQLFLDLTARIGITERLELRLQGEPLVVTRGEHDDTGNGDFSLAAKYRLFDAREGHWWPSLGVLPFIGFPIARAPHGTNLPGFGLTGIASFTLPWALSLDVNAGLDGVSQRPDGYLVQGFGAASLGRDITERWSTYGEIFFSSAAERGGRASVGLDAGVQFFVTRRLALDAAAETSLAGPGPDYAFRAGLSVRFGR